MYRGTIASGCIWVSGLRIYQRGEKNMKRMPNWCDVRFVVRDAGEVQKEIDGEWVPARSEAFWPGISFFRRLRLAWLVFTGKCDALHWPGQ
jgi:hypothetical protein